LFKLKLLHIKKRRQYMDIKKANVNLLLGKIGVYLNTQPEEKKKGKRFVEAKKALARMQKLFVGKGGEIELIACSKGHHVIPGSKGIALKACSKGHHVIPGN
jgi:hypothetical protein